MRTIRLTLIVLFALALIGSSGLAQSTSKLVEICSASAGTDATYLKDFVVQLDAAPAGAKAPVAKFSMVLSKNIIYRFTICNSDETEAHAVLQLYDMSTLLGSTFNPSTGKEYKSFDFTCQKTGVYHVFISFIDGKKGNAVGILSYIKSL